MQFLRINDHVRAQQNLQLMLKLAEALTTRDLKAVLKDGKIPASIAA